MLLNTQGAVFVGQRIDTVAEAWQMPQGGIETGESPEQAALRELKEEIGTNKVQIITRSQTWLYYDLPQEIRGKVWHGRYRGQKQIWFVMRFLGDDSDINLETQEPEFNAWRWAPLADVPALIVPFKRRLYQQIIVEFGDLWDKS